ncbi:hypothetical protein HYW32_02455 [Candidatus Berkelbacteria bacterium]|nr:hypothetical protein [Candidatus Berkelbacteria bacterium]
MVNKKLWILAGGAPLVALILTIIVSAFQSDKKTTESIQISSSQTPSNDQAMAENIVSFTPTDTGFIALQKTGKVIQLNFDDVTQELGTIPTPSFTNVFVSRDGTKVAGQNRSVNGEAQTWQVYDSKTGKLLTTFGEDIDAPGWSPKSNRILYAYALANGRYNLSIADPDGGNWKALRELPDVVDAIDWLPNETYALLTFGSGRLRVLDQIGLSSLKRTTLVERLVDLQISPRGKWILVAQATDDEFDASVQLLLAAITGDGVGELKPLSLTPDLRFMAWDQDEKTLLALNLDEQTLVRYSVSDGTQKIIELTSDQKNALIDTYQVLGFYGQNLWVFANSAIVSVKIEE